MSASAHTCTLKYNQRLSCTYREGHTHTHTQTCRIISAPTCRATKSNKKTACIKARLSAIKTLGFAFIMEIPSHVSFYSGSTIWIINCTIWPAGIGRRSLNLHRAEQELGGGSAQCERKNPTQRNKSLCFVISHQLSIPFFSSAAHLLSANFPLPPPRFLATTIFSLCTFLTSACPLFLHSFSSAFAAHHLFFLPPCLFLFPV